jgi:hypothetical protein
LKEDEKWIGDVVGVFCDPIIVYPSGWEDTLPDWIKQQITIERLIMNVKSMKAGGVPVGDTEVLAYMYPRTMESPLTEQWQRIYFYVFNQAMKMKKTEVPKYLQSEKLTDYDMRALDELKIWIYQKRIEHRKERQRGILQEEKAAAAAEKEETELLQYEFKF